MKNVKETKKLNNKGFSLVELIIVVAIMAVLVGVLAPQYIRYVEKSRRSADATTIDNFVSAMQVLASDSSAGLSTTDTYTVSSAANSDAVTISTELLNNLVFKELIDTTKTYTLKSTEFKNAAITVTLSYSTTDNMWKITPVGVPTVN